MAIKLRKLIMLSILFPLGLGTGLSSGEVNTLSMPTKEAVSYATSDDLNDHDTNHSSDYNWTSLQNTDVSTGGTLTGGEDESTMAYYYLADNVELSTTLTIRNYVTLCLNGKYIDGNSNGSVISVSSGSYFNLCDCSEDGNGTIKDGYAYYGGGVLIEYDSTFNMYGGTISNNTSSYYGGGVYVEESTFNMYGGTISNNEADAGVGVYAYDGTINIYGGIISNNTATSYGSGGGVYAYDGTINIYGGTISNNEAYCGGGVFVAKTTINLYDGTISGNVADDGGGVFVFEGGTFNMYGGTISGNTATYTAGGGGGIYVEESTFNMYGGTISGNTANNYGGGVFVRTSTFNMIGGYFDNDMHTYNDGTISIKGGYFSSTAYDSIKNYIADGYILKSTGDNTWPYVVVDLYTYFNDHTHDDWTLFSDSSGGTLEGGSNQSGMKYYYLNEDIELSSNDITISGYVALCLNGNTIKGTGNSPVISVSEDAYFNLCDCSGDDSGTITGGYAYEYGYPSSGGGVTVFKATFNMYGGSISYNEAPETGGGLSVYESTFNMYGGTISRNTATNYGGGVSIEYYSTFNMYGGTISNNVASSIDGVYAQTNSTLNIYSGYIKNALYNDGGTLSIKGGYFSSSICDDIKSYIDNDCIGLNISTLGKEFDNNYQEEYPYAVYYAKEYSVEDVTITYGTTYTPIVSDAYTNVIYIWVNEDSNTGTGLPTDVGVYTVTAYFLYTTTQENITSNYYGTAEFKVTITSSVTETPEEGEDESGETGEEGEFGKQDNTSDENSDNNTTDGDTTTTNDDSIDLSVGTIAGIVIGSVLVIGVIAFLVYFLFFRKRKGKGSK